MSLLPALFGAWLGLYSSSAHAVLQEEVTCSSQFVNLVHVQLSDRQCGGNGAAPLAGVCFYTVPCMVITPEVRAIAAAEFPGVPWANLTQFQKDGFMRYNRHRLIPTEISCGAIPPGSGNPPAPTGLCPPPNQCLVDPNVRMQPGLPDTRGQGAITFPLREAQPSAGAAQ